MISGQSIKTPELPQRLSILLNPWRMFTLYFRRT